jgi:hypothetical protein
MSAAIASSIPSTLRWNIGKMLLIARVVCV